MGGLINTTRPTVQYLLDQWAWSALQAKDYLGYPRMSTHERLRAKFGSSPNISPEDEDRIDNAMKKLWVMNRLAHDVILERHPFHPSLKDIGVTLGRKTNGPPIHQQTISVALTYGWGCIEFAMFWRHDD